MLEAVRNVPQEEGDSGSRSWFADDELELILWYSAAGEVVGFQLCYDLHRRERAFTWKKESGLTHSRIDSGEECPLHNRSPILISEPRAPLRQVTAEFTSRSSKLDPSIVELVATTISTFETSGSKRAAAASVIRFALVLPDHQLFDGAPVGNLLAISPDGSKLVYAAKSQLYMRRMAYLEFAAIPGTAGAQNPFFSPDGEWIAFWSASRGELMKVPAGGGAAKRICRSVSRSEGQFGNRRR